MNTDLDKFQEGISKIPEILAQFGYESLRPGQEAPINSVMLGQDTIAILATGGGKTLLAALPTVAMGWKTIMFSPLVSLMRDQYQNMNRMGVRAAIINSSQSDGQNYLSLRDWTEGRVQILYVAPERLNNPMFEQAMQSVKPQMVVVDECVSEDTIVHRNTSGSEYESVKIKDLKVGDAVECVDIQFCPLETSYEEVMDIVYKGVRPCYEISTDSGMSVKATGNHRVYTDTGWKYVNDLTVKDKLLVSKSEGLIFSEVRSISYCGEQRVYDIETRFSHTFLANGILVHNCHTVSQWSASFRPSYARIGDFIDKYNPDVVLAMTATATDEIYNDVKNILHIPNAALCRYYVPRTNLHLTSSKANSNELYRAILNKCREVTGSVIVYCQTVKEVGNVTAYLDQCGESVTFYHGKASDTDKATNMDAFMSGRARICVATNAFGMGIDKADIEAIIHNGSPGSIEAISQETGRAARDGRDAICHMFITEAGHFMQEFLFNGSNPTGDAIRKAYKYVKDRADADGVAYVKTKDVADGVGDQSAEGALNYLQNRKCVERFKPEVKLYTIGDHMLPMDDVPSRLQDVLTVIREFGKVVSSSKDKVVYSIDLAFIVDKVGKSESTVKSKLSALGKESICDVTLPFSGLATRIIHPPTEEDIRMADLKRNTEWKKIADERLYEETPDDKKQEFLSKYFEISQDN